MNGKKIAIAFAVLVYIVLGFFLAQYIAGAIYFLLNKTAPEDLSLDTWWTYWGWYKDDPVQHKRLQLAAGVAFVAVYLVPLFVLGAVRNGARSLHGDARFATSGEVRTAGLYGEAGIIVGKYQGQYLMFGGQQFVLLAAPTRSGKGVAIVLPNLLNYNGSVVVLDVKLENFKFTSGFRAKHGHEVFLFSPFAEDCKSHRWNPLDGINRNRNFRVGDILAIGQALYPGDNAKDSFWNDQARSLFLGLVLYLMDTPELPCTLGEVLRQSSGKGRPIKDHLGDIVAARSTGDDALTEECLNALNRFCNTSENTMASILATLNAPLTIFENPIVDAATSYSDIDLTMVRKKKMSIYIGIQPKRLADASLLINLFFSQLVNLNTGELPGDNPELKHQCLLILDEFTAIGKVGILAKAVSYIAGYNLRLLPIVQSIAQLESVYGREDTRTFVTNHALQIVYPPREQKDANEYSEMLGYQTEKATSTGVSRPRAWGGNGASTSENVSDQRRALLLPQELKELGQSKEIVMVENCKPILCEKARYFNDDNFLDRLKSVSPSLAALGKKRPTQQQLETAALVKGELAVAIPLLDIDLHKAKMEQRVRVAAPGERIDLAKLAIDVDALPTFSDPENPSADEVENLVDAFFGELDFADAEGVEVDPSEGADGEQVEPVDVSHLTVIEDDEGASTSGGGGNELAPASSAPGDDEPPDDYFDGPGDVIAARSAPAAARRKASVKRGAIDLSVLDK
ncbi:type IV secretory system conjugative DNA transfer family protein [Variovorax sp. VaC1]|uniref:type IV secretory system conjugative DNA transfer family protein n=1 Tax=Variovorax sp. VaC1 TaxID=3373132 RepID=UPI00374A1027